MSFKSEHPDYKAYESTDFYVNEVPSDMSAALQGFISRQCEDAQELKVVINNIAGRVPMELTTNWGWTFLIEELPYYIGRLCKLPLHKVMDFLADVCTDSYLSFSTDDLNELLEDLKIGYILEIDHLGSASWCLRPSVSSRTEAVEDTMHVTDICEQTLNYLKQAKTHLVNNANDRDLKDAIRDCMSAMESMLKDLSGESDIKDATTALRDSASWGPNIIVKDGLSLWDRIHALYPDIRHGAKESDMTNEEALYWLERLTCFIRYMSRVHNR